MTGRPWPTGFHPSAKLHGLDGEDARTQHPADLRAIAQRRAEHRSRLTVRDDLPPAEHHDPIGDSRGEIDVVGRHRHGDT